MKEPHKGLCLYGITIIKDEALLKFKKILLGWLSIFEEAPDEMVLRGAYTQTHKEIEMNATFRMGLSERPHYSVISTDRADYDKLKYKKEFLLNRLKRLILFCDYAEKNDKYIVHLGI